MDEEALYQAIFKRMSGRNYQKGQLDAATLLEIDASLKTIRPMFPGIQIEMRIIDSSKVKGMFKVDAPHFLVFFSEVKEGHLTNSGFMLQQVDLHLSSVGIGSCWQGSSKPVKEVATSELEFIIALAFVRPAEGHQRGDVSEFKREPLAKITSIGGQDQYLEAARLAPSAMNNQPWYFSRNDGTIEAFRAKSFMLGKMNHISLGIAICHIWLAALHDGKKVEFINEVRTDTKSPKGYSYVISLTMV